jgi:hypothetical protein
VNARDYYLNFQRAVHSAPYVLSSRLRFEEIDENVCYVQGVLSLIGDFQLHLAEYVFTAPVVRCPKYRYHLQTPAGQLISRWDNAQHHHAVPTSPDHRHDDQGVIHPSPPMDIPHVLDAILSYILPGQSD